MPQRAYEIREIGLSLLTEQNPEGPFGVAIRAVKMLLGGLGIRHQEFSRHTGGDQFLLPAKRNSNVVCKGLVKWLQ